MSKRREKREATAPARGLMGEYAFEVDRFAKAVKKKLKIQVGLVRDSETVADFIPEQPDGMSRYAVVSKELGVTVSPDQPMVELFRRMRTKGGGA